MLPKVTYTDVLHSALVLRCVHVEVFVWVCVCVCAYLCVCVRACVCATTLLRLHMYKRTRFYMFLRARALCVDLCVSTPTLLCAHVSVSNLTYVRVCVLCVCLSVWLCVCARNCVCLCLRCWMLPAACVGVWLCVARCTLYTAAAVDSDAESIRSCGGAVCKFGWTFCSAKWCNISKTWRHRWDKNEWGGWMAPHTTTTRQPLIRIRLCIPWEKQHHGGYIEEQAINANSNWIHRTCSTWMTWVSTSKRRWPTLQAPEFDFQHFCIVLRIRLLYKWVEIRNFSVLNCRTPKW